MTSTNPFDLLGDDEYDDPSQLIAAQQLKLATAPKKTPAPAQQPAKQPAKLPSKPLPPSQAVRETKNEAQRGGGRGGGRGSGRGRGRGRGGRGVDQDSAENDDTFGSNNGFSGGYRPPEDVDDGKPSERRGSGGPRGGFRGGRRGGFNNGEVVDGERPRRVYERRSGTGRGNEIKRDGSGRGNWGTPTDELTPEAEEPVNEGEKNVDAEKQSRQEDVGDANKENPVNEPEEEPEDKEMTLEEYQKVLEEKRKALLALKTEERKVHVDKELESMQMLSSKKNDDDIIFIKLGSEKDKHKEAAEREERAKKCVSINEFLKPAKGESYYRPGGRGRGRGRGRGVYSSNDIRNNVEAPAIEDVGQFPSLGAK